MMNEVNILGIPFTSINVEDTLDLLESYLNQPKNHIIVTPNPEGVMQARRNQAFRDALLSADLRLADGIGIIMASRYVKNPLPTRVRGYDTFIALLKRLTSKNQKHTAYFLGGAPGVANAAKLKIESRFAALTVIGHHHGFFTPEEEPTILEELSRLKPDIMLVCQGMPRSAIWAAANSNIPARLTMCLGGALDIMAGNVKLAPPLMRKLGLEWLYRLVCQNRVKGQPSRLRRQLDIPRFVLAVIGRGRRYNMQNGDHYD